MELIASKAPDILNREGLVNLELQLLLSEMRMVPFLVDEFIPAIFEMVSARDVADMVYGPFLKRAVQYAFLLLRGLAKGHTENSNLVFDKLDFITTFNEGYDFRVANLVSEVFLDNEALLRSLEKDLIVENWELAIKTRASRYLNFLCTILTNNDAPLKFNQDRLSDIVAANCPSDLYVVDYQSDSDELVDFHNGLIQMASLLCAGRHRGSIDFFLSEVGLSYDQTLRTIADAEVKFESRAVSALLMQSLFVDREPYELHDPLQPSRIMPPLSLNNYGTTAQIEAKLGVGPPKAVDPYASFGASVERPTPGFTDLKDIIIKILGATTQVRATSIAENQFLAELLSLARNLLLFGMFDGALEPGKHHDGVITLGQETIQLGSVLLSILDVDADILHDLDPADRYLESQVESSTVITLRTRAVELLKSLVGLRSSAKIQILLDQIIEAESGGSFEDETTSMQQTAANAMEAANSVKVFEAEQTAKLTGGLLSMLRYNDGEADLCFAAFESLVMFISQRYTFSKNIKRVSILGTPQAAGNYLKAGGEMSEYRRLRKWLHLDDECQQTIAVADGMCRWCTTAEGQNILRNLNLEEYAVRILRMRLSSKFFPDVIRSTMRLIGNWCAGNKVNQMIFAAHMESICLKLLWDPLYYSDAAFMIKEMVYNNEVLSVRFSGMLVNTISELTSSPEHGRQQVLLDLLDTLLIVEDHPVSVSQVKVCKGAMVSRELIETDGDLEATEWGGGKEINREGVLDEALNGGGAEAVRCQKAMAYYCRSMQVLGTCARGKMPTTELLCAAKLPFPEIMSRMQEIHKLCKNDPGHVTAVQVKHSLMSFFREVYVDTNSKQILRMLRQNGNGLWSVKGSNGSSKEMSIAQNLLNEIPAMASCTGEYYDYLWEEVVRFFIQYASAVAPVNAPGQEKGEIIRCLQAAAHAVEANSTQGKRSERENWLLSHLHRVGTQYAEDQDPGPFDSEEGIKSTEVAPTPDANTLAWNAFVQAAISPDDVRNVRGTDRMVGRGMMDISTALWKVSQGLQLQSLWIIHIAAVS